MTKEKAFEIIDQKWGFNLEDSVYIPKTHFELTLRGDGITVTDGKMLHFFAMKDIDAIEFVKSGAGMFFQIVAGSSFLRIHGV